MKKNIYNIIGIVVLMILWTSCKDELDKAPPQAISADVALSTNENVLAVLNGAYDALSNGNLFGGNISRNAELLAADGEIVFSGTFSGPSEIWRKEMTATNGDAANVWVNAYNTINICNNVLNSLDVVDPAIVNRVEGEAKFIRGLIYFELVKCYAKAYADDPASPGVPIVLTPTNLIDESSKVSRNSVSEVYSQVISDLQKAVTNLPAYNDEYANRVAANFLLARVYLQQGDYASALAASNAAIGDASGNFGLNIDYSGIFNRSSNGIEDIFSIQVSTQDGTNNMQLFFAPRAFGGRGDIEIQAAHLAFYTAGDKRLSFFYSDPSTGETRSGKWQNQFGNVTTMRMAELYLIRAECNVRLSSTTGDTPANDINRLRSRAGLADIASPTLNDVLLERKLELAQEGQALADFKRTKGDFYRLNGGDGLVDGFAWDDPELVFPIPDREIKVNSNLTQNDGY